MASSPQARVITYIDGFNLYFGLKEAKYRRFYWLDVLALSRNLLRPAQRLVRANYFTARITGPGPTAPASRAAALRSKVNRQNAYLDALATLPHLTIHEGHYLATPVRCM
jgi:hypothetical protein